MITAPVSQQPAISSSRFSATVGLIVASLSLLALSAGLGGCTNSSKKEFPEGLKVEDTQAGEGAEAKKGSRVFVHYTGTLTDGTQFDSSVDRQPFDFVLGAGQVIRGWDEGIVGMKVGGKRKLTISPELGYGEQGAGRVIPPNATLLFDVELLDVQ